MSAADDHETDSNSDADLNIDFDDHESTLVALMFESSPYGNVDAIVQHDGRSVYFYLNGDESFGTRACWVRNLMDAPYVLSQQDLEQGIPPMMPRTHCRTKEGLDLPVGELLDVVWLEEGNGAALFENDELIALIPPWSDVDGFHGYAAECVAESPIAWPLLQNAELLKRIENAQQFWQACSNEVTHPFAKLQPQLMAAYRERFGKEEQYFSLDGGQFPPTGAAFFRTDESATLISVGMSFRPQPNVEMSVEHPGEIRRVELAIDLPSKTAGPDLQPLLEQFGGLTRFPWTAFTWFGHGHTLQLSSIRQVLGKSGPLVELIADATKEPPSGIKMPDFRGDPVQLLWLKPAGNTAG